MRGKAEAQEGKHADEVDTQYRSKLDLVESENERGYEEANVDKGMQTAVIRERSGDERPSVRPFSASPVESEKETRIRPVVRLSHDKRTFLRMKSSNRGCLCAISGQSPEQKGERRAHPARSSPFATFQAP